MITSKQRAYLRGLANSLEPLLQVGKEGINEHTLRHVAEALEKRELIKCRVLETSPESSRQAADEIAQKIGAEVVQVIGYRFVLYKRAEKPENRKIELPKAKKK